MLEQRGWRKEAWQTPLEFAASLPAGEVAAPVSRLTDLYLVARFGHHDAGTGDAERFAALLASVQMALRVRRQV
jgi:hypothetical protein